MPSHRTLLGAAAFSLALAGGGAAGALLGTPSLSSAQDDTEITDADAGRAGPGHRGETLATAAEALGVTEDELRTALEGGQSIAQVAETEGVDVQTVVDALVADGTTRLNEAIAALPERMTALVNREGLRQRGGHGGPGGPHGGRGFGLDAPAEAIGITPEELRTALRDGSTIAEVAAANDVDVQVVIDALVAEASAWIDQAVADGKLTEEQASERKADLKQRITNLVNRAHHGPGPGDDTDDTDA